MKHPPTPTSIQCPFCRAPITVQLHRVVDAVDQPQLKSRLLAGQLNMFTCTNCRNTGALAAPFLYHDADKELALIFLPIESGLDNAGQQRVIGQLTQTVMNALPPEKRKAYLLQPRQFITMQSLLETILQADGVTPEMMQAQQERVDLLQRLIDARDEAAFEAIVKENDAKIDVTFLQLMTVAAAGAQAENRTEESARLAALRDRLLDLTTVGQTVKTQTEAVDALIGNPTRETLLEQLLKASDADTREALLAVGRQMLDYPFFQQLTGKIDAAKATNDTAEADRLTALRKEILALRDKLDAQAQQAVARRAALLRELMFSQNVVEDVQARADMMDDLFFSVLTSEMQAAQQAGDMKTFERLQQVGNAAMQVIQSRQPPEVQFLSALLGAKYPDQTRALLERNQRALVPELVQWLETIADEFREDGRSEAAEHLTRVVAQARELSGAPAVK
jgi:hypothetical protein